MMQIKWYYLQIFLRKTTITASNMVGRLVEGLNVARVRAGIETSSNLTPFQQGVERIFRRVALWSNEGVHHKIERTAARIVQHQLLQFGDVMRRVFPHGDPILDTVLQNTDDAISEHGFSYGTVITGDHPFWNVVLPDPEIVNAATGLTRAIVFDTGFEEFAADERDAHWINAGDLERGEDRYVKIEDALGTHVVVYMDLQNRFHAERIVPNGVNAITEDRRTLPDGES
ncbi:MAG: hypothetical protein ACREGI_03930 [Candidatus Levyibacteriota bacterium]